MDGLPAAADIQLNAEKGHDIFGDHQAAHQSRHHGDKEQCIDHIVQARLVKKVLEEIYRYVHKPLPMEEQVRHNGSAERHRQPFVNGVTGQRRVRDHQKGGKDHNIEYKVGFGRSFHFLAPFPPPNPTQEENAMMGFGGRNTNGLFFRTPVF